MKSCISCRLWHHDLTRIALCLRQYRKDCRDRTTGQTCHILYTKRASEVAQCHYRMQSPGHVSCPVTSPTVCRPIKETWITKCHEDRRSIPPTDAPMKKSTRSTRWLLGVHVRTTYACRLYKMKGQLMSRQPPWGYHRSPHIDTSLALSSPTYPYADTSHPFVLMCN